MIVSASRRTDIPAFFSDWFLNRIHEGYVLVPNPFNHQSVSRIALRPDVVDCIVFWSKNPAPMLEKLNKLADYKYYFQFTLNPYGKDIECNVPDLDKRIDTFRRLADKIGKEKVIWRYDPLLTNEVYTADFHKEKFAYIAERLKDHTERCMLGFIDHYNHIRESAARLNIKPLEMQEIKDIAASFLATIQKYPIGLDTCTNKVDLSAIGIPTGLCIDKALIEKITGYPINARKDPYQRQVCQCVESIDIGMYASCNHGCVYCYAIRNWVGLRKNIYRHDKNSPMLIGNVTEDVIIRERGVRSLRDDNLTLF